MGTCRSSNDAYGSYAAALCIASFLALAFAGCGADPIEPPRSTREARTASMTSPPPATDQPRADELSAQEPPPAAPSSPLDDVAFETEWRWVLGHFPNAADYRPADAFDPLPRLLAWARANEGIRIFDLGCRPLWVRRKGNLLQGRIHERTKIESKTKTVSFETINIDDRIMVTCGCTEMYERRSDGSWKSVGCGGLGCAKDIGYGLSKVTPEAAWFGAGVVGLSVECTEKVDEEQPCVDGGVRRCARCEQWDVVATSHEDSFGYGWAVTSSSVQTSAPADCAVGCPPIEPSEDARRAARAVMSREFLAEVGNGHPQIFRTRSACLRYRRGHAVARDEREPW